MRAFLTTALFATSSLALVTLTTTDRDGNKHDFGIETEDLKKWISGPGEEGGDAFKVQVKTDHSEVAACFVSSGQSIDQTRWVFSVDGESDFRYVPIRQVWCQETYDLPPWIGGETTSG